MVLWGNKGVQFVPDRDIPSLEGKVILVTGGNSGLGKQSILELAKHGPKEIWLGARSEAKAQDAIREITAQVPNAPPIRFLAMDLASLASVRDAATTFRQHADRLDILLLNAGIMAVPAATTHDGYEIQFGTNHLGHALLAQHLLPTLLHTAAQPGADVRVVVLSSLAHQYAPAGAGILFDTLRSAAAPQTSTTLRYGQSKLANLLYAQELARRHPALTVAAVHPGVVATNLANTMVAGSALMRVGWWLASCAIGVDVPTGALNQLWAATARGVESGAYYMPVGARSEVAKRWEAGSDVAERLWEWTEEELKGWARPE
ncbi:NAD(P)-binding protein [Trichocladium antarcticum]|uniref:NAD(P)-binding protein n=1 Tax=Trichocladium antarcticum TaxID=1450529 RepID=A0AAN6UEW3_9PEZI|nr:NAD(P)-binding protein [Trichocladium antarcticum]